MNRIHRLDFKAVNNTPVQIFAAAVFGLVLGVISNLIPPLYVILAFVGILGLVFIFQRPEYSIIVILFFLCTIINGDEVPKLNFGVAKLLVSEVILVIMFGFIIFRWMYNSKIFPIITSPLDKVILFFFGWSVLITIMAVINGTVDRAMAVSEIRIITYFLTFFAITNLIRDKKALDVLLNWFFIFATIVSLTIIAQYSAGYQLAFLPGRVEMLTTGTSYYSTITRITDTNGEGLVAIAFITKTISLLITPIRFKRLGDLSQWLLLLVGFIMSFNRAHWLVAFASIIFAAFLVRGVDRQKFFYWMLFFFYLSPVLIIPVLINPSTGPAQLIFAFIERAGTISRGESFQQVSSSSFRWRDFEYTYALPEIMEHPVTGIGLGAWYRPNLAEIDHEKFDGRAFLHNGHVWIALKTGLVGYGAFLLFSIMFMVRGLQKWRNIKDERYRGLVLGFTLSYAGAFLTANLHTVFMIIYWTPVLSTIMGFNEVIYRQSLANEV